ncbi:MAG: translocation/assembly module TamB domain-containing protein, partial [Deltaproteobacteria bacterium]|nr:translocation/assembly module TamB domain-containing protein [Deltaproteobacteria bacterium]
SPLHLFKGKLLIRELKADSVILNRFLSLEKSGKPAQPFSLPLIVYHIGVKRFYISRLSLGSDILGKPADFTIEAGITEEEIGIKSRLFVDINRTDGAAGSAFLEAEIEGTDPYLIINAGIDEPEKGLIGAFTGINTPISMTLKGSGRIKAWDGVLSLTADQLADIEAHIKMNALEDLNFDIEGSVLPHPGIIPGSLNELLVRETGFNIHARIKDKKELFLEQARFESDIALLDLNADLDLRHMTLEGAFAADLRDISPLGQLVKKDCSGSLEIDGEIKGPINLPSADLTLMIRGLDTGFIRTDAFKANALIEPVFTDDSSGTALNIIGNGNINGLYMHFLSDDLLDTDLAWNLDMTWSGGGDVGINSFSVNGMLLTADTSGHFNIGQRKGEIEGLIDIDSIDRYSGILNMNIPEGIGVSMSLDTRISGRSLDGFVGGKLRLNSHADKSLVTLMGPETEYYMDISLSENESLTFKNGKIIADMAELTFSGMYDFIGRAFDGLLSLEAGDLAPFSAILNKDIRGSAMISASLDGTMDMLNMNSKFNADNIIMGNAAIDHLSGSVSLSGRPLKNEGKISISLMKTGYRLNGDSGFRLDNRIIELNGISIEGQGFNMSGNISADIERSVIKGGLKGDLADFSAVNSFSGRETMGSASLNIRSEIISGKNVINLDIHGRDITDALGHTDTLDVALILSGDLNNPEITLSSSMLGYSKNNLLLKSIDIKAQGNPQDIDFTLSGAGNFVYGIIIKTSGKISLSSSEQTLNINSFQGEYGILPVYLTGPFRVARSDKGIELKRAEFNIAGGTVSGYGTFSEESMDYNMNFDDIPASLLVLAGINQFEGNAKGGLFISGTMTQPSARATFSFNDMRLRETQYTKLPSLNLSGNALLQSGRLECDLTLESQSESPLELTISLPVRLSLLPFSFVLPEDEDISGRLSGDILLENISTLAGIYDQKVKGCLSAGFDIQGTIVSPVISGGAELKRGEYENFNTGSIIKGITMDISADSKRFILNSISGTDGEDGKVSGKGWIDFSPSNGFPYNLSLNLKNMIFIRSNTAFFTVSGKPTISGKMHDHTLSGKFTVERGEYKIPERLPAEVTELKVTEINRPEQEQTLEQKEALEKTLINLDMSVTGTGQIYLTGRGLNSEWEGDINIKGTTIEPIIIGSLSVLRGSYNFLGKRFELREGEIDLDGSYPAAPYLNVTGESRTSEITAIINLTGDLKKPEVTLTSEPSLPSDEILSQLLFGRDVSQITPFQAIQLGNALNTMMGDSRYDIIGSTRKILGVDQLELVQTGDNNDESAVSVGKYLSDELYIELEKGLGTESGKASFTWEVTPNITIDTELNENSSTGVGLNWKWDY